MAYRDQTYWLTNKATVLVLDLEDIASRLEELGGADRFPVALDAIAATLPALKRVAAEMVYVREELEQ